MHRQGRRQGQGKKRPKNSKNARKIALLSLFQGKRNKRPKNSKKQQQKLVLFSLYLLYFYHL